MQAYMTGAKMYGPESRPIKKYMVRMRPFINLRYGFLCENPLDINLKRSRLLSLNEIHEKTRFGKSVDYMKPRMMARVFCCGEMTYAVKKMYVEDGRECYVVNPRLFKSPRSIWLGREGIKRWDTTEVIFDVGGRVKLDKYDALEDEFKEECV